MAIYTKVSRNDIIYIEQKFNLGKIIAFKGIKKVLKILIILLEQKIINIF